MSSNDDNIFSDEWRACLHAHYLHVIRTDDAVTEPTLRSVLLQTGLTDADIERLRDEALALGPVDSDAEPVSDELPDEAAYADAGEVYDEEALALDDAIPYDEDEGAYDDDLGDGYDEGGDFDEDIEPDGDDSPPVSPGQLSMF